MRRVKFDACSAHSRPIVAAVPGLRFCGGCWHMLQVRSVPADGECALSQHMQVAATAAAHGHTAGLVACACLSVSVACISVLDPLAMAAACSGLSNGCSACASVAPGVHALQECECGMSADGKGALAWLMLCYGDTRVTWCAQEKRLLSCCKHGACARQVRCSAALF
jgi:hypothetical protein